jgi:Zn-dependent peptidase ImmA (M78 family)
VANWDVVKKAANEILHKYGFQKPPVDIFEIASNEGFAIRYFWPEGKLSDYDSISGLLNNKANAKEVFLNATETPERQAFTLAHELGHALLGHKPNEYGVYRRDSLYDLKKPDKEKEADLFAAELLMPSDHLKKYIKDNNLTTADVNQLAGAFGVSKSAMSFRLKNM